MIKAIPCQFFQSLKLKMKCVMFDAMYDAESSVGYFVSMVFYLLFVVCSEHGFVCSIPFLILCAIGSIL